MERKRKTRIGQVVSAKMQKTIVVRIEAPQRHPLYRKVLRKLSKVKAHVEGLRCKPGDMVCIVETRPLSKEKHWMVKEIVRKGIRITEIKSIDVQPEEEISETAQE